METVDILTGELSEKRFQSSYNVSTKDCSEVPVKGNITETAYVPPQHRIQEFMQAGERLAAERRKRYDSVQLGLDEEAEVPLDPSREPNVDIVDVQKAAKAANMRIKMAQDAAVEDSARAEAARKEAVKAETKPTA